MDVLARTRSLDADCFFYLSFTLGDVRAISSARGTSGASRGNHVVSNDFVLSVLQFQMLSGLFTGA